MICLLHNVELIVNTHSFNNIENSIIMSCPSYKNCSYIQTYDGNILNYSRYRFFLKNELGVFSTNGVVNSTITYKGYKSILCKFNQIVEPTHIFNKFIEVFLPIDLNNLETSIVKNIEKLKIANLLD